jgi:hypothetical protein
MKRVRYFLLARLIRAFLQFGFLFTVLALVINLFIVAFNKRPSLNVGGGLLSFGSKYNVKASMELNIPDTITYCKDGEAKRYIGDTSISLLQWIKKTNYKGKIY